MSDIGISPGLFALVVALWTVALGLGACVLLALAGFLMAMPEGETRGRRIRRWTAGPAACAVTGAVAGFVLQGAVSDTLAWLIPALGLIAWVLVAFRLRAPANSPMMGALKEPRLRLGLLIASASLVLTGTFVRWPRPLLDAGCVGLGIVIVWAVVDRVRARKGG